MNSLLQDSVYFGVAISLASYALGMLLRRKTGLSFLNPLLVSIVLVIVTLLVTGVSYEKYNAGAAWLSYLLTPATICLAVPLYQQLELLRRNKTAIVSGIAAGVLSSMVIILLLALAFGFDHASYVTFLPKSITTAIGMGVAEELGGYVPVAVVAIVITGVLGNIIGEQVLRLFRLRNPSPKA